VEEVLLYQTSDTKFADRAIEALQHAGIPCYRLGSGFSDDPLVSQRDLGLGISIYLRRDKDYSKANSIIVELGAVVEPRITLPFWVAWVLYAVLAGVACVAAFILL
jgi:hypothetical protein